MAIAHPPATNDSGLSKRSTDLLERDVPQATAPPEVLQQVHQSILSSLAEQRAENNRARFDLIAGLVVLPFAVGLVLSLGVLAVLFLSLNGVGVWASLMAVSAMFFVLTLLVTGIMMTAFHNAGD